LLSLALLAALFWHCLLGLAPAYLVELCGPMLSARSSRSLCSTEWGLLHVPFARTYTRQKYAFLVVDPSIWRSTHSLEPFLGHSSQLKMVLFGHAGVGSASE